MQSVLSEIPLMGSFLTKAGSDFTAVIDERSDRALETTKPIAGAEFRHSEPTETADCPLEGNLDEDIGQALEAVARIKDDYDRAFALRAMAGDLDEQQLTKALRLASQITNDHARAAALSDLARYLDHGQRQEVLDEAFEAASQINDHYTRVTAFCCMAQHLAATERQGLVDEALEATGQIVDDHARVAALSCLTRLLNQNQLDRACDTARQIKDADARISALDRITCHRSKLQKNLLFEIVNIGNHRWSFLERLTQTATLQPGH